MAFKKVRLIVSPVSRPAWVKRYIPAVADALKEAGCEVETCFTEGPGDPGRLAAEGRGRCDAVLVAGGDGSVNEALNALSGSSTPAGILPFGTVNVFAREMGIPLHPLKAAAAFLKGREKRFDMGKIGSRHFLLMASFGFDVFVLRRNPPWLKRILGKYAFGLTGFFSFPFYRDRPIRVVVDGGGPPRTAYFAIFSNARCYAGEYVVAPDADLHDGLLDVTLFNCPGRLGLLKIFASFCKGTHLGKPWVERMRAGKVSFETGSMDLFQVDGDPIEPEAREITVQRDAIGLVVP